MNVLYSAAGLAALTAAGYALAQDPTPANPPVPVAPPATVQAPTTPPPATEVPPARSAGPRVIIDGIPIPTGPEVVYRSRTPGNGSSNLIVGSGNGFGNSIVVDGTPGGTTVIRNSRNGYGNRIIVGSDGTWLDVPAAGVPEPAPTAPVYRGKETKFWSERTWSSAYDCYLYWSVKYEAWFRYQRDDDTYRMVTADTPPAPVSR